MFIRDLLYRIHDLRVLAVHICGTKASLFPLSPNRSDSDWLNAPVWWTVIEGIVLNHQLRPLLNILLMCKWFVYIFWVCFLILQLIVQQTEALLLWKGFLMKCFFFSFVQFSKGISIMLYIFLIVCHLHNVSWLDAYIFLTWMKFKKKRHNNMYSLWAKIWLKAALNVGFPNLFILLCCLLRYEPATGFHTCLSQVLLKVEWLINTSFS